MLSKKKVLTLALTGLMAVTMFAGCGSDSSNKAAEKKNKDELVFVNYRDIRNLNPHLYAGEMYAQNILYDGLIDMVEGGKFQGALAKSWDISPDGLTYTFHIREGVKFSDGEICDANAIKANFDAILANKKRHVWLQMMNVLTGVEAPDKNTFVMKLSAPYYPMLTELAMVRPFAMISPKAMKDGNTKDGVNAYIGTGPYVLKESVTDQYAVFERNENYWGEKPKIKTLRVKVIPDNQTRIMALEKGEIDLIYGKNMIDADALKHYKDNKNIKEALSEPTSTRQIVLNSTNAILKDKNVRQALSYATNKKAISEGIFYGLEPVAETLYAKTIPYCNIDLKPFTYDAAKAESMLKAAGWTKGADGILAKNGQKLELGLLYNADSVTEKSISEFMQSEYKKIGVKLNIHGEEEQSYRDNMKSGKFDMVFNICWGTPYDPQSSLAAMTGPVYGDYAAQLGLEDKAEIDKTIKAIMTSVDEKERQKMFDFVLTRLHEDAVYIPLTYECNKAVFTSALEGVAFTQSQYEVPFNTMYFK